MNFASIPALSGMFLCVLLLLIPSAWAQDKNGAGMFSGAYLYEICASKKGGKEVVEGGHTACQAYIAGVVDYHKLLKSLGVQPLIDFCIPNTEPMVRLQSIVWLYLHKNKQHMEFMASPTVTMALYDYYPCEVPKKKRKR
ncbi:MAG: hypothetical protein DI626_02105 [Micavibrio aeruginosavorus]|uniref:Rap1a immunity protein domain-containing protein n=1 Tax=Micavibrio aeruginosavorus TaxID=349221 RepID=A0A2W5A4R7_9BACT|nr:MAG: hypothetical protein DI626_02105 [Micavibrio aeruginosavorus]